MRIRNNVKANDAAGHFSIGVQTRTPTKQTNTPKKTDGVKSSAAKSTTSHNRARKPKDEATPVKKDAVLVKRDRQLVEEDDDPVTSTKKRKRAVDLTEEIMDDTDALVSEGEGKIEEVKTPEVKTPVRKRVSKGKSNAWLPEEDWEHVKNSPEGKILFATDDYEEDMKAKAEYGALESSRDVKYADEEEEDCVMFTKEEV